MFGEAVPLCCIKSHTQQLILFDLGERSNEIAHHYAELGRLLLLNSGELGSVDCVL